MLRSAFNYAQRSKLRYPLILYDISMGSVAVLKAVAQENIQPQAIILELPFARFLDSVRSRLRQVNIPTFPMAELIVFWGSIQHQANGFSHNPVTYANRVKCPTLLFHGKLDKWTTVAEVEEIASNLRFYKQLVIFPTAGHAILVSVDKKLWYQNVDKFLELI
jgi:pimeloyl-ACP methyl ester carboxylesterase